VKFGSLFSGIGGFDLGFARAGMTCAWMVERDKAAQRVLRERFTGVPIFDDVTTVGAANLEPVDLVCGGFPCQDVSQAGRRAGLAGSRSGLWWEFRRILEELHPRWAVIENVPGLLSSNGPRDMGAVLWSLGELGYGYAYRVLDAQWFGVAQRRERVFIVGNARDWGGPAEVLLEPEGCARNPPARGEAREGSAGAPRGAAAVSSGHGWWDESEIGATLRGDNSSTKAPTLLPEVAWCLQERDAKGPDSDTKDGDGAPSEVLPPLSADADKGDQEPVLAVHPTLAASTGGPGSQDWQQHAAVASPADGAGVRRLTPVECERLQGFPDGWTLVPGASDSSRYRQLGNAVAVPCAEWIGKRIVRLEQA
jgi:DNA (cytosine-5)-methyltransferase 1